MFSKLVTVLHDCQVSLLWSLILSITYHLIEFWLFFRLNVRYISYKGGSCCYLFSKLDGGFFQTSIGQSILYYKVLHLVIFKIFRCFMFYKIFAWMYLWSKVGDYIVVVEARNRKTLDKNDQILWVGYRKTILGHKIGHPLLTISILLFQ